MYKVYKQHPKEVHFLFAKEAIVTTEPMQNWKDFFNQRIRWASKADKFDDKRILAVLAFIYLFNLVFLVLLIASFWFPMFLIILLVMVILKTIIELRFMIPVADFFGEEKLLYWFPVMQPVHIAYTIIAGWLGKFGKYKWKGRMVK
jgi:cellulose synthase/poly-beta-1,6-N-acetylglucosamine synthase-like glycosyltransferase